MLTILLIPIAIYLTLRIKRILIGPGDNIGSLKVVSRVGDNLHLITKDGKNDIYCHINNVLFNKIKGIN